MRILRTRRGFQADHSSSSYLFYAADPAVSAKGQQIAHRYSSRAEVDEQTARYVKWGESDLNSEAFKTLLGEHYDVMASESYDWWTLMIAVPKTPQMTALLAPFRGACDEGGTDVQDNRSHLVAVVHCTFDYGGPVFRRGDEPLDTLVELLAEVRGEMLKGDVSFLQAVASFYGYDEEEEEDDSEPEESAPLARSAQPAHWQREDLSKAELQEECAARGIAFRKSWTKDQLKAALEAAATPPSGPRLHAAPVSRSKPSRLSKAAKRIVDSLDRV